jgi:hypothetical protein
MSRSSLRTLALVLLVAIGGALGVVAFSGCAGLAGMERTYSVSFTEGDSTISGGVTLRGGERQTPNAKRQTPNGADGKTLFPLPSGPDAPQQWWPGYGFNFGGYAK